MTDLKYITNFTEGGEAHLNIYGGIGFDIIGNQFADEVRYLNEYEKVKSFVVHINSEGGSVTDGLTMIAALRNTNKPIKTIVEGIAASMAGVLAVSFDFYIVDYGRLMIHNASGGDDKSLENINQMLSGLFQKSGVTDEQARKLMDEETWLNADECVSMFGAKKIKIEKRNKLSVNQILNKLNNRKMDEAKIMELLGVTTPEEVITAIESLKQKAAENTEMEDKLKNAENECEKMKDEAATALVENAIEEEKIKPEAKMQWIENAKKDLAGTKAILDSINVTKKVVNMKEFVDKKQNLDIFDTTKQKENAKIYLNAFKLNKLDELFAKVGEKTFNLMRENYLQTPLKEIE